LSIQIGGQTYTTQPIPIEVVPGAGRGGGGAGQGSGSGGGPALQGGAVGGVSTAGGRPGDEFFITLTADKTRAYVGEQVVLVFRFYRRAQMWESPQYQAPRTEGFWREDMPPERNYIQAAGGRRYDVTEVRYALFPTRAGVLTVQPAEVTVPVDMFDRFFGGSNRGGPLHLRTDPVTVTAIDLPSPRPDGFSGVVAQHVTLDARPDRTAVPRGEAVSLKLQLTADGFLKSLAGLPLPALAGVRVHDAGESLNVDKSGDRLTSRYSAEKVLVPTTEGRFEVPPITFSYFDPVQGRYAAARTQPIAIAVSPSDLPREAETPAGPERAEIERLGRDLAFIHPVPRHLRMSGAPATAGLAWWLGALTPLILLGAWRWRLEQRWRRERDPAGSRQRRALAEARRQLKLAGSARERPAALALIARAALGFVADRTDRAAAALTADDVRRYAERLGQEEAGGRLAGIIDLSDAERFGAGRAAGSAGGHAVADLCRETEELLRRLDRAGARPRRGVGDAAGRTALLGLALLLAAAATGSRAQSPEAGARVGQAAALQFLAEGNQAYTANDVETALARYQAAVAAGAHDPTVDFNLGNAYARAGQLGRAMIAYLRAQRAAPRDRDVRANLAWVRAHTRDLALAQKLPPVVAQLVGAVHLLSLDEWSGLLLAVLWVLCGLLAATWWRGAVTMALRRGLIGAGAAFVVVAAVTSALYDEQRVRDQAVVVVSEVEVRSGPSESFPVVFRIHDGLPLVIRGAQGDWARIGLGGEWVGWVPAGDLARVRG
jgi:tetratricopeptide (TPR) repeat protein